MHANFDTGCLVSKVLNKERKINELQDIKLSYTFRMVGKALEELGKDCRLFLKKMLLYD